MELTEEVTTPLNRLLNELHAHFLHELERQETVLGICRAQGKAALESDPETLQRLTQSLVVLIEETLGEEAKRHDLLRQIVDLLEVPQEEHTLTTLIERIPSEWQSRFRDFQVRLRGVLSETRDVTRLNRRYLLHANRIVNDTLRETVGAKPGYTSQGNVPGLSSLQAMLLNAAG